MRLWDAETGALALMLRGHSSSITCIAFSPDGTRIASAARDRTIRFWDPNTVAEERTLKTDAPAYRVAFSPDGTRIAAPVGDSITVWDFGTGRNLWVLREPGETMRAVAFSPDGRYLAGGCVRGKVSVWDAATAQRLWTKEPPGMAGTLDARWPFIRFSRDSRWVVSGARAGFARLWDSANGDTLLELCGHQGDILCADFSPDGASIATGGRDKSIKIWDLGQGRERLTITGDKLVDDLSYHPDGTSIVASSQAGTAIVYDSRTGEEVLPPLPHSPAVPSVAFSPDGTRIVTVGADVRLWDSETGEPLANFGGALGLIFYSVAFSPNGRAIAAASPGTGADAGFIKIWEAADPREFETAPIPNAAAEGNP